jgi:hypothetical protein
MIGRLKDVLKQCGVVSCVVWCGVCDCGSWCGVLCGLLYCVVWCCVACLPFVLVCLCVRARVCSGVYIYIYIYMCVLVQIERGGECEISCKWNLDVAENCLHLKTSTIPRISFLIHSSSSISSSRSSSSTAL